MYDLDGRLVNTRGYLIDADENIINTLGKVVFRKDLLSEHVGQDSELPKVFRMGVLDKPENEAQASKLSGSYDKK